MNQMSYNKSVLMLLLMLTASSCCSKHEKEAVVEKPQIELSSAMGTKALANSLENLQNSESGFGVYGYKTQPNDPTPSIYRLFNNIPAFYDSDNSIWTYTPTRYWDSNPVVSYQFFAYWPHLGSSAPDDGSAWVSAPELSDISSSDDMYVTINDIPNWQDTSSVNTQDYLVATKKGHYKSSDPTEIAFGNDGVVRFEFSHILSKLIIKGFYEGDADNHVKVHNITLSGTGYLLPGGTSDYTTTFSASTTGFGQTVGKVTSQQGSEQVLYNNDQGCQILQDAFKSSASDNSYKPTPICGWLVVPTDGWSNLTLSITYAIGSAQPQSSETTVFSTPFTMESGKSYILNLKFNTEGGIELEAMYISKWTDEDVSREVYNW